MPPRPWVRHRSWAGRCVGMTPRCARRHTDTTQFSRTDLTAIIHRLQHTRTTTGTAAEPGCVLFAGGGVWKRFLVRGAAARCGHYAQLNPRGGPGIPACAPPCHKHRQECLCHIGIIMRADGTPKSGLAQGPTTRPTVKPPSTQRFPALGCACIHARYASTFIVGELSIALLPEPGRDPVRMPATTRLPPHNSNNFTLPGKIATRHPNPNFDQTGEPGRLARRGLATRSSLNIIAASNISREEQIGMCCLCPAVITV